MLNMFMYSSKNKKSAESSIYKMWLNEDKVLCLTSKKHSPQTLNDSINLLAEIKKISKGQKHCMLMDLTNFQLPTKEAREYKAKELPKMTTAIAIVSKSVFGTFAASLFFALAKQPYPIKTFSEEQEAKKWLKQYLSND